MAAGSIAPALSSTTISPDSTVSTGLRAALKFPTCTVCGLGMSSCTRCANAWQTGNRNAARMNEDDLTVRLSRLFDMALPPWRRWHAPRKKPRAGRWHPDAALSRYGPDFRSNFTGRRTALDRETMIGCAPRCLFQLELGEDGV